MELYNQISFKTSQLITKAYSTSFSLAVGFLPKDIREAIYSIYGFVRLADEIVDTFHHIDQKVTIEKFEQDYYLAMEQGISMNPVLHAFAITVKKYNLKPEHIKAFLSSMKSDLNVTVYDTDDELDNYIYGSADVVGLMCLMVFVNGDIKTYSELELSAMKLGSAFQKINFLRDLKADIEGLNRSYFPNFKIQNFDKKLKNELINDIDLDFEVARTGIKNLPGKTKLAVYIAFIYYKKLLNYLQKTPAEKIMQKRIRVSNTMKFILIGKAYLHYYLRLI